MGFKRRSGLSNPTHFLPPQLTSRELSFSRLVCALMSGCLRNKIVGPRGSNGKGDTPELGVTLAKQILRVRFCRCSRFARSPLNPFPTWSACRGVGHGTLHPLVRPSAGVRLSLLVI